MSPGKFASLAVALSVLVPATGARGAVPAREAGISHWTNGRIEIARLGIDAEIREGDDAATLRLSVGHVPGTALPGDHGNVALAAHRYSHFRGLRNVRCGDRVQVTTPDGEFGYEVDSIRVVEISQVEVLEPTPEPTLTLVTCFPFDYVGDAPQRLIVRAHRVSAPEAATRAAAAVDAAPKTSSARN